MDTTLNCIDLFSGCGGFSLGLHQAGIRVLAAIDFDPKAIEVYRSNLQDTPHILCKDLTEFPPTELDQLLGDASIDLIAGGPPCQGFSQVRQRDGANNGKRLVHDPRRSLYEQYFEYVNHFRPKMFVMENVLGIRSAAGGKYFAAVKSTARRIRYRITGIVVEAWKLGVPQKRRRQLIVGTREDIPNYFRDSMLVSAFASRGITLGDAIGDLPRLRAGGGDSPCEYDQAGLKKQLAKPAAAAYLREVLEVDARKKLTAHIARPHSQRDLDDFAVLEEGETAKQALKRGADS